MAIINFKNKGTEDVAHAKSSKQARGLLPVKLHGIANLRLLRLDAAASLTDFSLFPSFSLEKLKGDRSGQYSIRINQQYRICFVWKAPNALDVEIIDYH